MKRSLYNNSMFVADLVLTSLWAIFAVKYLVGTWEVLLLLPLMRIALAFQMHSRSPWSLVSAVAFGCYYASVDDIARPIEKMTNILGHVLHIDSLTGPVDGLSIPVAYNIVFFALMVLFSLWLVAMPIAVSLHFKNLQTINWSKRWVQIYGIAVAVLGTWSIYEEGRYGLAPIGLFLAPLPAIYWMIYNRKGRSIVQLLISRKDIVWYAAFLAYYTIALTIGLRGINSWNLVALITLLPLLYVMLIKVMRLGKVLTRICVALAAAGLCYITSLNFEVPYVMVAGAVALCVYAGVEAFRTTKSKLLGGLLLLGVPVVVAPSILGLNPYVCMDAITTYSTEGNGVYVIKSKMETPDASRRKQVKYCGYGYGLRDSYGVILPMKYKELEPIGSNGEFVKVKTYISQSASDFGIFDIKRHRWIVNPDKGVVCDIVMMNNVECALYDDNNNHFATLYLPGYRRGNYYCDTDFIPHFPDSTVSTKEFLTIANAIEPTPDGYHWEVAQTNNPEGFRLLSQVLMVDKVYPSALNNLNYIRAVKQLVKENLRYKGDLHRAMTELDQLCNYGTASGSSSDSNKYHDYQRLLCFVEFMQKYDNLLSAFPDNKLIFGEYQAWINLIQTMSLRLVDMYEQSGRYDAEDITRFKKDWFAVREAGLPTELAILTGTSSYTVPAAEATKLSTDKDFDALFANFAPYPDGSDYEDTMYTKVRPAFNDWRKAREAVARSLPANQARSYSEYTRVMTDAIFKTIKGLDWVEFRPAR